MPHATVENTSMVDNFAEFRKSYQTARRSENRQAQLQEFAVEEHGILGESPENSGGYRFGCEIEFESHNHRAIGISLHESGVTNSPNRQGYHARRVSNSWTFESDASVTGGELVSPILEDTATSWSMLRLALEIIENNNGNADAASCGGHINIDTTGLGNGDLQGNLTRLAKMALCFEDVMFRLGANPHRDNYRTANQPAQGRYHRVYSGSRYANPLANNPDPITSILRDPTHYLNRSRWLNLSSMSRTSGLGRAEFRVFDGSTDFAVWQTRIIIAAHFIKAATNPENDAILDELPHMLIGSHRNAEWRTNPDGTRKPARVKLSGEEWRADTERFRVFLDMLFDNETDKKRVITLFAMNDWNWRSRSRN